MCKYKFLVATDMDYTLLLPGMPVSKANRLAIKAIEEAGGCVTLATGRTFYLCGTYARDLGITIPLITSNGAALSDPVELKDIKSVDFPPHILKTLIDLFEDKNVDATGYSSEGLYFFPASTRRGFIDDYNSKAPDNMRVPILDKPDVSFNKFLLISPDREVTERIMSIPKLQVVSSAKDFVDVMMAGTSKGLALKEIASSYGIPDNMVFALGDSENDISLLKEAGHAIAMAGSDPKVIDVAEFVTSDCASDGFARAVEEFILPLVR